ncbi:unnamed protein product [Pylaiella littoralis]
MDSTDSTVGSGFELSRIIEEHRRQDEKRRVKRAANRKSASTSRARKKAYVDDMTAKNERMKQHALVLSMLPDLVLAVCRTGEMTYVSPACQWLLLHSPEDITGANIFELVAPECHSVLRKIISDNLSRPVQAAGGGGRDICSAKSQSHSRGEGGGETDQSDDDEPQCRGKLGNHRERLHRRYRQSRAGELNSRGKGRLAGASPASLSSLQAPKREVLRIYRGDKTTVWCESRLSVRNEKNDDSNSGAPPVPLEIILTLRTVAEGRKTEVAYEFAGGQASVANHTSRTPVSVAAGRAGAVDEDADEEYVEADDDGYQCEVEAEEDSTSGGWNDVGTKRKVSCATGVNGSSKGARSSRKRQVEVRGTSNTAAADPMVGREERSLSQKRQRASISKSMEEIGASGNADKSGGDNSSTGGDTGGCTTHEGSGSFEGSGSCNEADSNGEGEDSMNGSSSKWGDGDGCGGVAAAVGRSSYRSCDGGSDDGDGASAGTSAADTDFGDDVQTAVQSLILMGGDFNKAAH